MSTQIINSEHQEVPMSVVHHIVGLAVELKQPRIRNERGLSQSTENAILLAGAAAIALIIVTVITAYVRNGLPD